MTKRELNDKLAELYGLEVSMMTDYDIYGNDFEVLLIDDWNRLMPLAILNNIGFVAMNTIVLAGIDEIEAKENYSDHESPDAAARYAIAMALVKLAESKS